MNKKDNNTHKINNNPSIRYFDSARKCNQAAVSFSEIQSDTNPVSIKSDVPRGNIFTKKKSLLEKGTFIFLFWIATASFYVTGVDPLEGASILDQYKSDIATNNNITFSFIDQSFNQEGRVLGEDDNKFTDEKMMLSENYRIRSVNLGSDIILLADNSEETPLEVKNIKSDSYLKKEGLGSKALITWSTNKLAKSEIQLSMINDSSKTTIKNDDYSINHNLILSDLDQSSVYIYSIIVTDRRGNKFESTIHSFHTGSRSISILEFITNRLKEIFG